MMTLDERLAVRHDLAERGAAVVAAAEDLRDVGGAEQQEGPDGEAEHDEHRPGDPHSYRPRYR